MAPKSKNVVLNYYSNFEINELFELEYIDLKN